MDFSYNIEEKDKVSVINLSGNLMERGQANELLEGVEDLIIKDKNKFVINMENMKYISSTGLNVLVTILTKVRKTGGDVAICCMPAKIKELLVITKLITVFNVSENLPSALEIFETN